MNLFCLLWTPLFYLFWVSLRPPETHGSAGIWALLLGSVFALVRFITGPWVSPGTFGFSRWLSALVDTAGLPALVPFLFFGFFAALKIIPSPGDPAGFALLWLIPQGIFRSFSRAGRRDPVFLVLVPVLWTALALGISFFVRFIPCGNRRFRRILALLGMAALLLAAVTCYWAFFCQKFLWGWILFALTLVPFVFSISFPPRRIGKTENGGPLSQDGAAVP
jgi:multisubunit Na+/H+ antiporter MnhF subunit